MSIKFHFLLASMFLPSVLLLAQAPTIAWQKSLGGVQNDVGVAMDLCADGGYITASQTLSNTMDVLGNHGGYDAWVIRFTSDGTVQWKKCLGGSGNEFVTSIKQTDDGGFIVASSTTSNDGDVSGNNGESDIWLVKLTALGEISWQHCIGGSADDSPRTIEQQLDGGFFLLGSSYSNDGDASGAHGSLDMWVLQLDPDGIIIWQKLMGSSGYDEASALRITPDGGCIVVGSVSTVDGDITDNHGNDDAWVAKLSPSGSLEWQRSYGGSGLDLGYAIALGSDGGYLLAAGTSSNDGDVSLNYGSFDIWLVRLDAVGTIIWERSYGGSGDEQSYAIQQISDSGFVALGYTSSTDGQVSGNHGGMYDAWAIKVDAEGDLVWQKPMGGSNGDVGRDIVSSPDGGFALLGSSNSNDGDLTTNHGGYDTWIVKLGPDITGIAEQNNAVSLSVYPNPTNGLVHVACDLEQNSQVRCTVFNSAGQLAASFILDPQTFCQGNGWAYDASSLSPGVYQIQILSDRQVYTRQFVRQ